MGQHGGTVWWPVLFAKMALHWLHSGKVQIPTPRAIPCTKFIQVLHLFPHFISQSTLVTCPFPELGQLKAITSTQLPPRRKNYPPGDYDIDHTYLYLRINPLDFQHRWPTQPSSSSVAIPRRIWLGHPLEALIFLQVSQEPHSLGHKPISPLQFFTEPLPPGLSYPWLPGDQSSFQSSRKTLVCAMALNRPSDATLYHIWLIGQLSSLDYPSAATPRHLGLNLASVYPPASKQWPIKSVINFTITNELTLQFESPQIILPSEPLGLPYPHLCVWVRRPYPISFGQNPPFLRPIRREEDIFVSSLLIGPRFGDFPNRSNIEHE
jgi:hypothetical protein